MHNIGIVGNTGYIAKSLITYFENNDFKVTKIGRSGIYDIFLDLSNLVSYDFTVLQSLDYVIITAAISSPDKCSKEYDYSYNINVVGTKILIEQLLDYGIKVLFFSSDAVYGKSEVEVFTEKSEANPFTHYGIMKKEIEDTFKNNELFKALRLSYVVSISDKFTSYCINTLKNDGEVEVFHPFYRNCIVLDDVVSIVNWLINNWNFFEPTILNVCGNELISRIRIVDEINRYLNNSLKYKITIPDPSFFINRPRITQMKSLYLQSYGIIKEDCFSNKIQNELRSISL